MANGQCLAIIILTNDWLIIATGYPIYERSKRFMIIEAANKTRYQLNYYHRSQYDLILLYVDIHPRIIG